MNDLELLQQYEPVIKFTEGEMFFPCAVDEYVRRSSLWMRPPDKGSRVQIPAGALDLQKLVTYSLHNPIPPDHDLFLRFVQNPLNSIEYRRWQLRKDRPKFKAPGRLARVGLAGRLADAFFNVGLLLRGRVPGGTPARAEILYREIQQVDPRFVYYGRVIRERGYIILHYLFFYTMNNWRSTFHGVNDHEADWEQIFVYLNEQENAPPAPAWVAYASHDYDGDDLRRRWDDPEFMHIGSHPVIFAGAGSHASYFQAGEYLAKVELAFMKPVFDAIHFVQHFWRNVLRQGDPLNVIEKVEEFFRVPYVDYARGDGVSIGPDQLYSWSAILMDNEADWIFHYRGLWGLDTRDPLKGESAPGGPRYNRDGTVRQSWYDPLGWAGLRKVPPFPTFESALKQQITELEKELQAVDAEIAALDKELPELELEVRALQQFNHLVDLHQKRQERLRLGETDLNNLFARRTELQETLGACQAYDAQIQERGVFGSNPQAHIHHKHMPQSIDEVQSSRIASFWAAISSGLLLLSTISLAILQPDYWIAALSGVLILFWVVEAILRQRLIKLLLRVTLFLAFVSVLILVYEFYAPIIFALVIALALTIILDNVRELRAH